MGNFLDNSTNRSEDQNNDSNQQYTYPPKNGNNYFSTHFIVGGERFETSEPEAYLFGENLDLNFLSRKPTAFPYLPPQPQEPTRALRSLINIRKETLKFVKTKIQELTDEFSKDDEIKKQSSDSQKKDDHNQIIKKEDNHHKKEDKKNKKDKNKSDLKLDNQIELQNDKKQSTNYNPNTNYNIEFVFDSDVKCAINIYYFSHEQIKSNSINYISKNIYINSPTYYYEEGANQLFSQPQHIFNPSLYDSDDLSFKQLDDDGNFNMNNNYPFVIHCVSLEGDDPKQSHSLIATIEKNHDGKGYSLKPLKQKLFIDGLLYLLQEIYGIEKKNLVNMNCNYSYKSDDENQALPQFIPADDDLEDNGNECIICFVEAKDTLILPCRHLAICSLCGDSLRYQASSCPICRAPFRALLQIKPVRKLTQQQQQQQNLSNSQSFPISPIPQVITNQQQQSNEQQQPLEQQDVPPGYIALPSLVEALNGPFLKNHSISQNILMQKNNTNSINETSFSELTPRSQNLSQRSQLSGQLSTNLSNGLNVTSFRSSRKQKLRKQNSNTSLNSLRNDNLLNQENDEISLNLDNLDQDEDDSIGQIELASGQQLSTNLSTKSALSTFSSNKETTKLLSVNRAAKQSDDQINLRKRSQSDTHSNQSRNSNFSNASITIEYPIDNEKLERLSIKNNSSLSSINRNISNRHTPEIAEDDD